LMTSLAFIAGCIPLWTATGAGSVARQIMGTTVIGGMLAASAIGIFFVPAVFYLVERFSKRKVNAPLTTMPTPSPSQGAADDYHPSSDRFAAGIDGRRVWLCGRPQLQKA